MLWASVMWEGASGKDFGKQNFICKVSLSEANEMEPCRKKPCGKGSRDKVGKSHVKWCHERRSHVKDNSPLIVAPRVPVVC